MRHPRLYLPVIFLFLLKSICFASYITIDTDVLVSVNEGQITIDCKVTNNGDETAHQVEIEADFGEKKFSSHPANTLAPGKSLQEQFQFTPKTIFSRMIIPLAIRYKDANLYSFSAISYADAKSATDELSAIYCQINDLSLSRKGNLVLTLKSLDDRSHNAAVSIITPHELTVTPIEKSIRIPKKNEVKTKFEIDNFSALTPSTYAILCIISEKRTSGQYEAVFSGRINVISSTESIKILSNQYLIWIIISLIIIYFLYQFRRKRSHQNGHDKKGL